MFNQIRNLISSYIELDTSIKPATGSEFDTGLSIWYRLNPPDVCHLRIYPHSTRLFVATEMFDTWIPVSSDKRVRYGQHSRLFLSACAERAIRTFISRLPSRWSFKKPVSMSKIANKVQLISPHS